MLFNYLHGICVKRGCYNGEAVAEFGRTDCFWVIARYRFVTQHRRRRCACACLARASPQNITRLPPSPAQNLRHAAAAVWASALAEAAHARNEKLPQKKQPPLLGPPTDPRR